MFIYLLIVGLTIFIGLTVTFFILIQNLLKKIEIYENYIIDFKNNVQVTLEKMREIDKEGVFSTGINSETGLFESNDPTSQIFKQLSDLIEKLNEKIQ